MKQLLTSMLFLSICFASQILYSQVPVKNQKCLSDEVQIEFDKENPYYKKLRDRLDKEVLMNKNNSSERSSGTVYTFPVVVHVHYYLSGENISEAQIKSQIVALNRDYRKLAGSIGDGNGVDTEIEFKLASIDPEGKFTNGIDRIKTTLTNHKKENDQDLKDLLRWDSQKYLNIYIVKSINSGSGILGYSFLPPMTPTRDGLVVLYNAFGTTGTLNSVTKLGRTSVHEIGHYLGLKHPWGQVEGDCNEDDEVTDTPQCENIAYVGPPCTSFQDCGFTRQIENYMDYSEDDCMNMFTQGQKDRMRVRITNSTYGRANLVSSSNLKNTGCTPSNNGLDGGVLVFVTPTYKFCDSDFIPTVRIKNFGTVDLTSMKVSLMLDNVPSDTLDWTGTLKPDETAEIAFPTVSLSTSGNHTIVATSIKSNNTTDGFTTNNSVSLTFEYKSTPEVIPYTQTFETSTFPPSGWTMYNPNNDASKWSRGNKGGFATSSFSAKMDNYTSTSGDLTAKIDYLVSPKYSLSNVTNSQLTFNVAYAPQVYSQDTFPDRLNVYISENCGKTWVRIYGKTGKTVATGNLPTVNATATGFTPTSTSWRAETVDIKTYDGKSNILFKVENVSGWGNYLWVDDFKVTGNVVSSTNEISINDDFFDVIPNPSYTGQFKLTINNEQSFKGNISIYNILGEKIQQVYNGDLSSNEFDVNISSFPEGIYILGIQAEGKQYSKRLIYVK